MVHHNWPIALGKRGRQRQLRRLAPKLIIRNMDTALYNKNNVIGGIESGARAGKQGSPKMKERRNAAGQERPERLTDLVLRASCDTNARRRGRGNSRPLG